MNFGGMGGRAGGMDNFGGGGGGGGGGNNMDRFGPSGMGRMNGEDMLNISLEAWYSFTVSLVSSNGVISCIVRDGPWYCWRIRQGVWAKRDGHVTQ